MANGKAKGSSWERDIARLFTKWITGVEKPYLFWRSPASGGLGTIKTAENVSGDIIAIKPEGEFLTRLFSIEAKTGYPHACLFKHLRPVKNDEVEQFWNQCITGAREDNKSGMLIFKKKGNQPIIGIERSVYDQLVDLTREMPKCILLNYTNGLPDLVLMDLAEFLVKVTPDIIKRLTIY